MCELFAMSGRRPATVTFSLETFARHGGLEGPHRDGWGIAYYEGGDVRLLREPEAAADSPWVRFIEAQGLSSSIVVSHIRKATIGPVVLKNTQPYGRELGGHMHVFAHNGHLPGIGDAGRFPLGCHRPVGDTDSEIAFCALLQHLEGAWSGGVPALSLRVDLVAGFAAALRPLGLANFLYSDGEVVFAHGHRRRQADGHFGPPGLHVLSRACSGRSDPETGCGVEISSARQQVLLAASVPLTGEDWTPLGEGELVAIADGRMVARVAP